MTMTEPEFGALLESLSVHIRCQALRVKLVWPWMDEDGFMQEQRIAARACLANYGARDGVTLETVLELGDGHGMLVQFEDRADTANSRFGSWGGWTLSWWWLKIAPTRRSAASWGERLFPIRLTYVSPRFFFAVAQVVCQPYRVARLWSCNRRV